VKAIAVFQFYFPYVLPRADDWPTEHIGFQFPNFTVGIHPRSLSEELFPHGIDKTLSSMTLTLARISLPTGMSALTVRDRCHDRIEVRVHGELADSSDAKLEDVQEAFRDVAIRACNAFLNHCRVIARTPFVAGVERHYRIEDGRFYVLTPHTITWFNGEDGSFLPAYEGDVNGAASSGAVRSPESGSASMSLIQQSFQSGEQPSLPRSLIVDAEEHVRTLRLREAIIALGTSCEVASNEYLTRSGRSADPQTRSILKSRASFAEKRFHLLTNLLSGRSLKSEDFTNFDLIKKTYRTRNNLAHEGKLYFEDAGNAINVDQQLSTRFLAACEVTIAWIESL
jgi:hypothetical protein